MVSFLRKFAFTSKNGPLDMIVSLEWYDNAVKVSRKKGVRKNKLT